MHQRPSRGAKEGIGKPQGRILGSGSTGPRGGISGFGSGLTHCLEIEGNHLASSIPEHLRHVVGRVHACALGVYAAHLAFIIAVAEYRIWPRPLAPARPQALPLTPSHRGPCLAKTSRILHKLHGGLGEQLIRLEFREGRDDVTSVLLCAGVKGRGCSTPDCPLSQPCLPFEGAFLHREMLPTQDSVEV